MIKNFTPAPVLIYDNDKNFPSAPAVSTTMMEGDRGEKPAATGAQRTAE